MSKLHQYLRYNKYSHIGRYENVNLNPEQSGFRKFYGTAAETLDINERIRRVSILHYFFSANRSTLLTMQ